MANKYPYVASGGPLVKTIDQLRKSFPKEVTAETLRKLGVAPQNESYVINVLRFLNVIDEEGKKVDGKAKAFLHVPGRCLSSKRSARSSGKRTRSFSICEARRPGQMDRPSLAQFFRTSDHSTEIRRGVRQAGHLPSTLRRSQATANCAVPHHKQAAKTTNKKRGRPPKPKEPRLLQGEKEGRPPPPAACREASRERRPDSPHPR